MSTTNNNNAKIEKITRVIIAVHNSPNKSVGRAALWARLVKLRCSLKNN